MKITNEDLNVKEDDNVIEYLIKWEKIRQEYRKEQREQRTGKPVKAGTDGN